MRGILNQRTKTQPVMELVQTRPFITSISANCPIQPVSSCGSYAGILQTHCSPLLHQPAQALGNYQVPDMLLESSMQSITPLLRPTMIPTSAAAAAAASAAAANAAGSSSAAARIKPEPTCSSLPPGPSKLTTTQRGELELARQRAVRAAAGRKPTHGGTASHQTKRQRDSAYHSHAHKDMDFLGSDDGMDSDTDISKLSAEEQERVIAARLAETDNEKDARRLKRCVWTDFRE